MEFFLFYKMYMYKWKITLHKNLEYGNSNISLTPICGMLNNYKEERRKNDKNG